MIVEHLTLTKMITLAQLKNFCEKNNVRYEINPLYYDCDRFLPVEEREIKGYEIGMNNISGKQGTSSYQWVWFECYTFGGKQLAEDCEMMFRERYSLNNGKSYKGWRESWAAEATIERRS